MHCCGGNGFSLLICCVCCVFPLNYASWDALRRLSFNREGIFFTILYNLKLTFIISTGVYRKVQGSLLCDQFVISGHLMSTLLSRYDLCVKNAAVIMKYPAVLIPGACDTMFSCQSCWLLTVTHKMAFGSDVTLMRLSCLAELQLVIFQIKLWRSRY